MFACQEAEIICPSIDFNEYVPDNMHMRTWMYSNLSYILFSIKLKHEFMAGRRVTEQASQEEIFLLLKTHERISHIASRVTGVFRSQIMGTYDSHWHINVSAILQTL